MDGSEDQHILDGLGDDIFFKTEIVKSLALPNQVAHNAANPEMLKYLRNRLKEPYIIIQKRLKEMGVYDESPKNVANGNKTG